MAIATPCQTDEAVYTDEITEDRVLVAVDMPWPLQLSEDETNVLRATLHNAMELVMAPYWARRRI